MSIDWSAISRSNFCFDVQQINLKKTSEGSPWSSVVVRWTQGRGIDTAVGQVS